MNKVNNLLESGSIPNDVELENFSDEYNNMMELMKTNLSEEEMNNFLSNYEKIYKNLSKYEKPIQDAIDNKNPQDMQAIFKQIKSDINLKFRENLLNRAENLIDKMINTVGNILIDQNSTVNNIEEGIEFFKGIKENFKQLDSNSLKEFLSKFEEPITKSINENNMQNFKILFRQAYRYFEPIAANNN